VIHCSLSSPLSPSFLALKEKLQQLLTLQNPSMEGNREKILTKGVVGFLFQYTPRRHEIRPRGRGVYTFSYCISVLHLIFVFWSINVAFTFYFVLFVDMFRPHKAIFRCYSILFRSWCSVMPFFPYAMVPAMCSC
jgi:hypothetical protein